MSPAASPILPSHPMKIPFTPLKNISLGIGLLAIVSFFAVDQELSQFVSAERHPWLYRPVRELTDFAEGKYYFASVALIWMIGWVVKNKAWKDWGLFAFLSLLFSGICLQITKHLVGRQRPHVTENLIPDIFHFYNTNSHYHSFPSGHSQTAFSFATVLWITYPKHRNLFFTIAAILALTRLPLEEHFLSDILIGGLLGFWGVIAVAIKMKKVEFDE